MLVQLDVNTDVPFLRTVEGVAVSVQTGALDAMPVPLTFTLWGLPVALLAINIELNVVVAEAGLDPQLCVTPNTLLALVMPLIVRVALPVLVSAKVLAALVLPLTARVLGVKLIVPMVKVAVVRVLPTADPVCCTVTVSPLTTVPMLAT